MNFIYDVDLDYCCGFYSYGFNIGLKKKTNDCAVLVSHSKTNFSFVATQNTFRSRSIDDTLNKGNDLKILVVFSGNANACTGKHADETINHFNKILTKVFKCKKQNIFFSFTGVVGRKFPYKKVSAHFEKKTLAIAKGKFLKKDFFSNAILTTDTREKKIATCLKTSLGEIKISACAKGSGMICPNMATMLAYVTTDIKIKNSQLQKIHREINQLSFNAISVDGDTSTNDSFFVIANGQSGVDYKKLSPKEKENFKKYLNEIAKFLAFEIVKDGEGATKFVEIEIQNAKTIQMAKKISKTIANSLLVKTAIFGNDANYGRILVALGNSGEKFNSEKVKLYFGDVLLYQNGEVLMKNIKKADKYLQKNININISVDLGLGDKNFSFYTCDISYNYVKINAEYTT